MPSHPDLIATIQLVTENYSGYRDKFAKRSAEILAAQQVLIESDIGIETEIDRAIRRFLATFADGHVSLQSRTTPANQAPCVDLQPTLELTTRWAWLRLPSFDPQFTRSLIHLLRQHHQQLCDGRTLILDLRDNHGGCDDGYEPLLPYVITGDYQVTGMTILSTPANIAGWEKLPALYPDLAHETLASIEQLITKMRQSLGEFVPFDEHMFHTKQLETVHHQPSQVLILMNRATASSAEQFLLAAQQSQRVTLIGENSAGVLDYSNVREFPLPSGLRSLWLATSRSLRLPDHGIDGVGIAPNIQLPAEILNHPSALSAWFCTYLEQIKSKFAEKSLLS